MLAKFARLMEFFPGQHSMLLKHSSSESILISLCVNIVDRKGSPSNAMQSMKQRNRDRYQYVTLKPVHSIYEQYYIFPKRCHLILYPHCTLWKRNEQDVRGNVLPPTRQAAYLSPLHRSLIGHDGTTARSALTNQLHQRMPPRMLFLLMQESTAERVAFERVAAQIVGQVLEPPHLLA